MTAMGLVDAEDKVAALALGLLAAGCVTKVTLPPAPVSTNAPSRSMSAEQLKSLQTELGDYKLGAGDELQIYAMDIAELKREYGRDICFWGGVGAQSVLARTTPEQVKAGVHETLRTMASGGGYIAAPCHTLTDEVSWESVIAFHEAVAEYGGYPIDA